MTLTVHIDLRTKINVNKLLNLKYMLRTFNLPNIQAIVQGKLLGYQLNELLQQLVHD